MIEAKVQSLDSHLAAIIGVTSENAEKPDVVRSELKVASAYLPLPKPEEMDYVRARVNRADPKEYDKAIKEAAKAKKELDILMANMESERTRYMNDMKVLKDQIEKLKKDLANAKHEADCNLYGMAAVGLLILGGIAIALSRYMAGAGLMVAGVATASVPYLLDSPYFLVTIGGLFIVSLGFILWHLYNHDGQTKP